MNAGGPEDHEAVPAELAALPVTADEGLVRRLVAELRPHEPLPPLQEAVLLRRLSLALGSQAAAAARLERSGAWVSQRLALLSLTRELQAQLTSGELPVKIARSLGRLPADQQEAAWEEIRNSARTEVLRLPTGIEAPMAAAVLVSFFGAEFAEEVAAEVFAATRR